MDCKRSNSSGNVDGKTYFNYILDSIWNAYKDNLGNKLGITDLKQRRCDRNYIKTIQNFKR